MRLEMLRDAITYSWPLLAFLVLFPLFTLSRYMVGAEGAVFVCGLYALLPPVQLIALHLDQVVFPLLSVSAALLARLAIARRSAFAAAGTAMVFQFAVFSSFALLFIAPFIAAPVAALRRGGIPIRPVGVFLLVVLLVEVCNRSFLGYDLIERYHRAMDYHLAWIGWEGGLRDRIFLGFLNLGELVFWCGVPVSLLCMRGGFPLVTMPPWRWNEGTWMAGALAATLFVLAFVGVTKSEIARLWIFAMPFICVVAARPLAGPDGGPDRTAASGVLSLQLLTVFALKLWHDYP